MRTTSAMRTTTKRSAAVCTSASAVSSSSRVVNRAVTASNVVNKSVVRSSRGKALIAKAGSDDLKNKANDLLTTAAEKWEETEDKPTVVTLALAGLVTLIVLSSLLGALDKIPFLGSILELVGIGYTAYFAYNNLLFTPDREELAKKVDDIKSKII